MPHVELSISGDAVPEVPDRTAKPGASQGTPTPGSWHTSRRNGTPRAGALSAWCATARSAPEPCLVLDAHGRVVACSRLAGRLLGIADATTVTGRRLVDVVQPIDFTVTGHRLADWELARVPPLLALATGSLARGLLRFRIGAVIRTVDAVSVPLADEAGGAGGPVGSLTFLSQI